MKFQNQIQNGDLVTVCRQFRSVSSGKTAPEKRRLEATRRFFSDARLNLEKCISELDAIMEMRG